MEMILFVVQFLLLYYAYLKGELGLSKILKENQFKTKTMSCAAYVTSPKKHIKSI